MELRRRWVFVGLTSVLVSLVQSQIHGNDTGRSGNQFGKESDGKIDIVGVNEFDNADEIDSSEEIGTADADGKTEITDQESEKENISNKEEMEEEEETNESNEREKRNTTFPSLRNSFFLVGRTFNLTNLTSLTNNVQLTLNGKNVNLENFHIDQSDVAKLDTFLKGEPFHERMYVAAKLAGIEQTIARAQRKNITTLAIEDLMGDKDDIILDPEDVDELEADLKEDSSNSNLNSAAPASPTSQVVDTSVPLVKERVKRKILATSSAKWPTTIHYVITTDFNLYPSTRNTIDAAVKHWEDETCLKFVKVRSYSGSHIRFQRLGGCWSKVGRRGGGQTISIGPGCETIGIVAHEIGHALGFKHEQSRPDRSSYVTIHSLNIKSGESHNFLRKSWKDVLALGVPYDYASLMHYGTHYFSKNGQKTISAKEVDMERTIGSRVKLSFYDVKLANLRYCSSRCSGGLTWSSCRNDGYRDPKNCNKCKCPDGWTGTYCTVVANAVSANCGSEYLTATSSWKYMSSPNYDTSGFPANTECSWRLKTYGSYRRIVMQFTSTFKLHSFCLRNCRNYVEVRYQDLAKTGPRYCCSRPTKYFRSHGNEMMLLMRINSGSGLKGFKIKYRYETCGGYTSSSSAPPCIDTQAYKCNGVYYYQCRSWWWGTRTCTGRRVNTCYRQVKRCYSGFKLVGSWCYRVWSAWSSWSCCTRSYEGYGTRTRTRTCLKAPCSYLDPTEQKQACNKNMCPTTSQNSRISHNVWSAWSSWSCCTTTCKGCGSQTRTRTCLKMPCSGLTKQEQDCYRTPKQEMCPPASPMSTICHRKTRCYLDEEGAQVSGPEFGTERHEDDRNDVRK